MLFDVKSAKRTYLGLTAKEVLFHIERGHLPLTCKIHHPMKQRWEPLRDNHSLAKEVFLKLSQKPLSYNYESLFYHWSLKNFISHQGYFTLMEVIEKLQKNEVDKSSLINHPTIKKWVPIQTVEIYGEESVRVLFQIQGLQKFFAIRGKERPEV